jgi:hypothetical protein
MDLIRRVNHRSMKEASMRKSCFLIGFLWILIGATAFSVAASGQGPKPSSESVPPVILEGLDALRQFGPDEAAKAWSKGSSWEGSTDRTLAGSLRSNQEFLGTYRSFEILSVRPLSATTRVVYLTLNYDKEPRFAKFLVYNTAHSWILLNFKVDGDAGWMQAELK